MASQKNNIWLIIVVLLVVTALGYLGLRLIIKSNDLFSYSVQLTGKTLNAPLEKQLQALQPNYSAVRDGYAQAFSFFMLAVGLLLFVTLLPRLQNFSIGPAGVNVSLSALQQKVDTLITQNN